MLVDYCYCTVTVAPLKALPSHASEQVSQLLIGECATIVPLRLLHRYLDNAQRHNNIEVLKAKYEDGWVFITTAYDGYTGWIRRSQLEKIKYTGTPQPAPAIITSPTASYTINGINHPVPLGSELTTYQWQKEREDNIVFSYFSSGENVPQRDVEVKRHLLVRYARLFTAAPYQWGGRSVFGIDCSGLTQIVYKMLHYTMPRDASQQALCGAPISSIAEAKAGDLAFFTNKQGKITHVGVLNGEGQIIHATEVAGRVVIEPIDDKGIFSLMLKKYSHSLCGIRRIMQ